MQGYGLGAGFCGLFAHDPDASVYQVLPRLGLRVWHRHARRTRPHQKDQTEAILDTRHGMDVPRMQGHAMLKQASPHLGPEATTLFRYMDPRVASYCTKVEYTPCMFG